MKRVLIIACNSLSKGGIQSVIMSIVRELGSDIHFDIVRFYDHPNDCEEELKKYGRIIELPYYKRNGSFRAKIDFYVRPYYLYRSIKKIIKENGPYDAVHCHNFSEGGIVLAAAKKMNIPVRVIHSHSSMTISKGHYINRFYIFVYKSLIKKNATHKLACSKVAGEYLYGNDKDVIIIPNAIDLEKFKYSDIQADNIYSIIHVGRWGNVKNQVFLIDIIAEIVKYNDKAKLTLVGYGEKVDKDKILGRIKEKNMENHVVFYPGDTDIHQRLCENNVFILPSLFEGLPVVIVEAQATGNKCFASDRVTDEANLGLVDYIPLESGAKEWAKKIVEYIEKKGSIRTKLDMSKFNIKNIKQIYYKIYNGDM